MQPIAEASPRFKARIAGLFEVLEAATSGFGQVIVPGMLVVSGDAAATAAKIMQHQILFRLSITAAIVAVICHMIWTLLFYDLFKPVNRNLSLVAACLSFVAISMQSFCIVFQLAPLVIFGDRGAFGALNVAQLQGLALLFLKLNAHAFYIYLALFGFWCVLIGYLIFRSTFMPRIIGVLEAIAGLCWLTFLWPPLAHYLSPYNQALAALGELSLMLWLLAMGVNTERWKERANVRTSS
jgi:Domain of unknown function (DUF4386)